MARRATYYVLKHLNENSYLSVTKGAYIGNPHSATHYTQTKVREYERKGVITGFMLLSEALREYERTIHKGDSARWVAMAQSALEEREKQRLIEEVTARKHTQRADIIAADDGMRDWAQGMAGIPA